MCKMLRLVVGVQEMLNKNSVHVTYYETETLHDV